MANVHGLFSNRGGKDDENDDDDDDANNRYVGGIGARGGGRYGKDGCMHHYYIVYMHVMLMFQSHELVCYFNSWFRTVVD